MLCVSHNFQGLYTPALAFASPGDTSSYISHSAILGFTTNLWYFRTLLLRQCSSTKLCQTLAGQVVPTTCWGVESPIVLPLSRCVSPTMGPDILYEICPGQWLVGTKLSHSNRELCIGWTPLVGRRGNPYSNGLIKQSKGRVNGEKHFFSCLISWLRRYCALSSAQQGVGLRSPHQLHLPHPFFLSCPELMIYWCASFPPPAWRDIRLMKSRDLLAHPK